MKNPLTESLPDENLPECCNSGCRFCVLDYPELFLPKKEAAGDAQVSDYCDLARALERAEEILHHLDSEGEF